MSPARLSHPTPLAPHPWYREPWPWILMAGPALVIVAGVITAALAISSSDGLVADDYYRRGLAINRDLAREERARALGVRAQVWLDPEGGRVRVALVARAYPASVRLTLVHRARAGLDRSIALERLAPGLYEAPLAAPAGGAWRLVLEDGAATWRVTGERRAGEAFAALGNASR